MKKLLLSACLMACCGWIVANPVNIQTAKDVAAHFMAAKMDGGNLSLDLISTYGTTQQPALYVFSINKGSGFVIISAEDAVIPVLGYSATNAFAKDAMVSPELAYWLNGYTNQIEAVIKNGIKQSEEIAAQWNSLTKDVPGKVAQKITSVAPLLATSWDQLRYYNDLCPVITPTKNNPTSNAPTGCVATAMAQIMHYWQSPTTGIGTHSYSSTLAGTLSADFGNTVYDWTNMPNTLNKNSTPAQVDAVATLMLHCGISVDMDYEPDASGAFVISSGRWANAEDALKTYFGYSSSLHGEQRSNYSDTVWIGLLKAELDNGRPVLYAGYGVAGGHAFDFDGYDNSDKFHINWGWSGYGNGFYTVDNLEPTFVGTGGGIGNFNSDQMAILGIKPGGAHLNINSESTTSADSIIYNTPYSIATHIKNIGGADFDNGLLLITAVNIHNKKQQLIIDSIRTSIAANADYAYDFSTEGIPDMTPATYQIVYKYIFDQDTAIHVIENGIAQNGTALLTVQDTIPATPAGIGQATDLHNLVVFPNPAADYINIEIPKAAKGSLSVALYNIEGKKVLSSNIEATNSKIPVRTLANGIYFLMLNTDSGTYSQKISILK